MSSDLDKSLRLLADFERPREKRCRTPYTNSWRCAGNEITKEDNAKAYDRIKLRPRVLRDVSTIDTSISLFGERHPHPIVLAPMAYQGMVHPEGEVATARGAAAAGAVFSWARLRTPQSQHARPPAARRSGSFSTGKVIEASIAMSWHGSRPRGQRPFV